MRTVYAHSDHMVGRRIGPEFVLVPQARHDAELEATYSLGGAGAFIWERIDGRRDGEAIVDALVEAFNVRRAQAAADYHSFSRELFELGALKVVPAHARGR